MSRASTVPPHHTYRDGPEPYLQLLALPQHEQTVAKLRELVEADYQRRLDHAAAPAAKAALSRIRLSSSQPS
jgi:hypothetical protein